jgi:hypothetical protein
MMLAQQTALSGDQLEKRLSTELSNVVLIDDHSGSIHCAGGPEIGIRLAADFGASSAWTAKLPMT